MSSEWRRVRIGDIGRVITGKTPSTSDAANFGGPYPFITIPDLNQGREVNKTERSVSEKGASSLRTCLLPSNAVLMSCIATIGKTGITTRPSFTNQQINSVICGREVLPKYLYYVFSQLGRELEAAGGGGSVYTNVSKSKFSDIEIPAPSIQEQAAISELLGLLDDRITLLRETNATLEAIAQALFKSWFVDFDPVRAKQEGRAPEGMDEATAALFPDGFEESELGLVPRGWSYVSLRDVVSIFDSKRVPLSGQDRAKRQGPYPYYGAAALMDSVDDYLFDGVFLLTGEDGSVADANGYPITQYVWGKIWVNNHAHVLQGKNGISTEHVMLSLKRTNIQPFITGAVQAKLSQSNLWRIMFLNPQHDVATAFGCILEPLFARIRHNSDQAQTLATLRDTLLPRLISGQLRLPETEALIEEATA